MYTSKIKHLFPCSPLFFHLKVYSLGNVYIQLDQILLNELAQKSIAIFDPDKYTLTSEALSDEKGR